MTGGGMKTTNNEYEFDTMTAGLFAEKGKLNSYQIYQAQPLHETKPYSTLVLGQLREQLRTQEPYAPVTK